MSSTNSSRSITCILFSLYSNLFKVILYVTSLNDMSYFTTPLILVLVFLYLILFLQLNQLTLSYFCISCFPLKLIKSSQTALPYLFINKNHHFLWAGFLISNILFIIDPQLEKMMKVAVGWMLASFFLSFFIKGWLA